MPRLTIALRATTSPADDLVGDDGVLDGFDVADWPRLALGLSAEWGDSALVRLVLFRVAPGSWSATSLVTGATRAPAFGDGILAVAKRGQMTGGAGGLAR